MENKVSLSLTFKNGIDYSIQGTSKNMESIGLEVAEKEMNKNETDSVRAVSADVQHSLDGGGYIIYRW